MSFLYSTARCKGSKKSSAFSPLELGVRTYEIQGKYCICMKCLVPGKCWFLFLLTFWIVDCFTAHHFSYEIFCVTLIKSYCLIIKLGRDSSLTWDLSNAESGYL